MTLQCSHIGGHGPICRKEAYRNPLISEFDGDIEHGVWTAREASPEQGQQYVALRRRAIIDPDLQRGHRVKANQLFPILLGSDHILKVFNEARRLLKDQPSLRLKSSARNWIDG